MSKQNKETKEMPDGPDRKVFMSPCNYEILKTFPDGRKLIRVNGEVMESPNIGKTILGQPVNGRRNGRFTI